MPTKDQDEPRNSARREALKSLGAASAASVIPASKISGSAQAADAKPGSARMREALETLTAAAGLLQP